MCCTKAQAHIVSFWHLKVCRCWCLRIDSHADLRLGEHWSLDFLSDTFGASRKFPILAVNVGCCCENLCLMADISISGARVARELDALVA